MPIYTRMPDSDVLTWATSLNLLVPLVVAFITKRYSTPTVKAITMAVGSAVVSGLALVIAESGDVHASTVILTIIAGFVSSGAMYARFWRPLGLTDIVGEVTRDFGLGRPLLALPDGSHGVQDETMFGAGEDLMAEPELMPNAPDLSSVPDPPDDPNNK